MTSCPASASFATSRDPTKPAPPVTRILSVALKIPSLPGLRVGRLPRAQSEGRAAVGSPHRRSVFSRCKSARQWPVADRLRSRPRRDFEVGETSAPNETTLAYDAQAYRLLSQGARPPGPRRHRPWCAPPPATPTPLVGHRTSRRSGLARAIARLTGSRGQRGHLPPEQGRRTNPPHPAQGLRRMMTRRRRLVIVD